MNLYYKIYLHLLILNDKLLISIKSKKIDNKLFNDYNFIIINGWLYKY